MKVSDISGNSLVIPIFPVRFKMTDFIQEHITEFFLIDVFL